MSQLSPQQSNLQFQIDNLLASDKSSLSTLITASHILAKYKILDGFGHITVRSQTDPSLFYYTSIPAALIESPHNYTIFNVADGTPLNPATYTSPYSEHYIHAGFYATYPEVNSVVHSHASETIPFGVLPDPQLSAPSNQRLRAIMHTAGFLGSEVPIWDARDVYPTIEIETGQQRPHNLLVNTFALGQSLATAARPDEIARSTGSRSDNPTQLDHHAVVLQRGHGFSAIGKKIEEAVFNSYYTVQNAIALSTALSRVSSNGAGGADTIKYLSDDEIQDCTVMDRDSIQKVWPLWAREVERDQFYTNLCKQ